jgi:thiamine biosynthesis protein ThiS
LKKHFTNHNLTVRSEIEFDLLNWPWFFNLRIMSVSVTINGESRVLPAALTVEGLLKELGIEGRKVAVERNLEIVPKSAFNATQVADGDRLEIVHFIGGG